MKQLSIGLAICLAAFGVSASAQEAAPEEAQQEKKICRTQKATGSLTRRTRICMTETQWRELNNRTRRGLEEMGQSGSGAPACVSMHDAACGTAPGPGGTPGPGGM